MISAVLDTNVLVRGALSGNTANASKGIVDALLAGRFLLVLLAEVHRVLMQYDVRARHGHQTDDQILDFCRALQLRGRVIRPTVTVSPSLTRDATDAKWVALALTAGADYLVTLDSRHLLRLGRIGQTQIVRPRPFLSIVSEYPPQS